MSRPPNPVHLSYHCYADNNETLVFDGMRTGIPSLGAGGTAEIEMYLVAPETKGPVRFRLTLVQEFVTWLDVPPFDIFADCSIYVE